MFHGELQQLVVFDPDGLAAPEFEIVGGVADCKSKALLHGVQVA